VNEEEIGSRTSACAVGVSVTSSPSSTTVGLAALTRGRVSPSTIPPPMSSRHETYGVLPEKLMSGRVELLTPVEIGAPPLATSKCALVPVPTSRETNTWSTPATCSSQATHGTAATPGLIVPAATRGSSALAAGSEFNEQRASLAADSPQPPNPFVPFASSVALS